jgi:molybdopterin synthase sulfur carrier subunit
MKVNFFATLRDIVGGKTVEINVDQGATVQEVLEAIFVRYPPMRKELMNDEGHLHGHVHFFVNGRDVQFLERNVETRVEPDDVLNVFPAVGGG